ncbi:protein tincar isoform X2 [Venturia canescens]|uniref:protein tincar isoform X2 n=1 Tax=Venturia canescens TaxID=32260 RepID=UPI001C9C0698|nr:protein tincar isoform X2 [Venturia canescens]
MSMTGSLMGYENNNEVNQAKCKKPLKTLPVVSSVNASGVTTIPAITSKSRKSTRISRKQESCHRGHVNGLWSVWYGIIAVSLQAYVATRCAKRFVAYLSLPWPADSQPPKWELHACIVLAGTGVLLLPVLLAAAFLKLGNLANDGVKLGRHLSTCTRDPPSSLLNSNAANGLASNLWRHGGPTAAFVHLCTAMCFLLPSLLMEARLIHAGFLPKDAIWRTDLDWVVLHRDRLVVLGFMNPSGNLSTLGGIVTQTPQPFVPSSPYNGDEEDVGNNEDEDDRDEHVKEYLVTTPRSKIIVSMAHESSMRNNNKAPEISTFGTTVKSSMGTQAIDSRIVTKPTVPSIDGKVYISTIRDFITTRKGNLPTSVTPTTGLPVPKPGPIVTALSGGKSSRSAATTTGKFSTSGSGKNSSKNENTRIKSRMKNATSKSTSTKLGQTGNEGNITAHSLQLVMNSLADLDHPDELNIELRSGESYGPVSLEYLNYAIALGVYSVRYPAVFWSCNKALGTIFSLQLVANSAQSLLAYAGMSVLYKIQVVGPLKVLPLLRHRTVSTASTISSFFGDSYFLLNPHVTLALFALSSLLVLCSSMVMYLYAHGRFAAFLNQERERRIIVAKDSRNGSGWGYFTHCAALCVFLAIAICSAPLLYDYTVVYRGSLDGAIFACIVGTIIHLFLWLVLWIFLTIKQKWVFKLRVTIGRATVRSARSVKLVTDVDLISSRDEDEGASAPLLVVGNGRTYTIADTSPKKAIMSVIQKAAMERKARNNGGNVDCVDGESTADGEEQIYWLRPKLRPSPAQSPTGQSGQPSNDKGWLNKKLKPKVTFNDLPSTSGSRNKGKARRGIADGGPDDDGDYATLRELPLMSDLDPADDTTSEENKLLECVNDDQVTYYASGNRDLQPSEGDPSPLLTPEPLPDPETEPLPLPPPTPTNLEPGQAITGPPNANHLQTVVGHTPRCLRRADSGMPHEELTPRSDSSASPPLDVVNGVVASVGNGVAGYGSCNGSSASHSHASSNSETSSGVHSNASNTSNVSQSSGVQQQRRATSVDDLTVVEPREEPQWRSCSLQRGTQPPTSGSTFSSPSSRPGTSQSFSPQYVNHTPLLNGLDKPQVGCPAVILENPNEATVVIRRRLSRPKIVDPLNPNEEPFSRSTNMRMTSFTEGTDLRGIQASSATLPHYPTQPVVTYPHCSTMPLPHASHSMTSNQNMAAPTTGGSCGSVTRHANFVQPQQQQQQQQQSLPPPQPQLPSHPAHLPAHTTLPSHHNGTRLIHGAGATNPFVKRFPPVQVHSQPWALPGHHTFPQQLQNKLAAPTMQIRHNDRDSANFSMASSGDSDTCLPH